MTVFRVGQRYDIFIGGGTRQPSEGRYLETRNPADRSVLAEVASGTASDIDCAVMDSLQAFKAWSNTPPVSRGRILTRIGELLVQRREEFAVLETLDNGKPLTQARKNVDDSARYFEFFGGAADKLNGATIPLGPNFLSYTQAIPFGVVGQITPWNAPLLQAARGVAPALAAGNCVVLKPAEETPLSALALGALAFECGLPAGVLNVVPGIGEVAGAALVSHRHVRKVAFTGSVPTGKLVNISAAERLVPTTLELGGKSANIIFNDVDLDKAAAGAAKAINTNAGQNCTAGSRLLVQEDIHDEMIERLQQINAEVIVGPGMEDPTMGPITTSEQYERVQEYLAVARDEGAVVLTGGKASEGRSEAGYFVHPTLLLDVKSSMRVCREEIFGPVVTVQAFKDEAEAIAIANNSDYGLVAGVWSNDFKRLHRVASELEVGQVFINEYFIGGVETPFGGMKDSGYGREKGMEALLQYTQVKAVSARL